MPAEPRQNHTARIWTKSAKIVASTQDALVGAEVVSNGTFLTQVYEGLRAQGIRGGFVPAGDIPRFSGLLDSAKQAGLPVDQAAFDEAHYQALSLASPGASVRVNAVGQEYGAVAVPWSQDLGVNESEKIWTMQDIVERSQKVAELRLALNQLVAGISDQNRVDDVRALLESSIQSLNGYSTALSTASQNAAISLEGTGEALNGAITGLTAAQDAFRLGLCGAEQIDEINCTWESIQSAHSAAFNDAMQACEANGQRLLPEGLETALKVLPIVADVLSGADTVAQKLSDPKVIGELSDVLGAADQWTTLSYFAMRIKDTLSTTMKVAESTEKALKGLKEINGLLDISASNGCDTDSNEFKHAQQVLEQVATQQALLSSFRVQLDTLAALVGAIDASIGYYSAANSANVVFAGESTNLGVEIQNTADTLQRDQATQRAAVPVVCKAVAAQGRVVQKELVRLSQMLQTTSGSARVEPGLRVPGRVALSSNGVKQVVADVAPTGFWSVWSADVFPTPEETATGGSSLVAEQLHDRFQSIILTDNCRLPSSLWPKSMSVVSRVLSAEELSMLKLQGHAAVNLGLEDLLVAPRGERFAGVTLDNGSQLAGDYDVALAAPVVVGVRYDACFGTGSDPCCKQAGCRGPLVGDTGLQVVAGRAGSLVPTAGSCPGMQADSKHAVSKELGSGMWSASVEACMLPVASRRGVAELHRLSGDGSWYDFAGQLAEGSDSLCTLATDAALLSGVKGQPLFGTWDIAYSADAAEALVQEVAVTPPGAGWTGANQAVTGMELQFYIIATPLADPARANYAVTPWN